MDRLSPLDAVFLELEDADPHVSLAIASVAVLDGPVPPHRELVDALTTRLPLMPRYRQKIRRLPFDLGAPIWVDDDRFDPAAHIHRVAVPAPGDQDALCELVALLMAERLDRARPLWEAWVVEGLADGRWAILSKIHHCLADGVSGATLLETLLTGSPRGVPVPSELPDSGVFPLLLDAVRDMARGPADLLWSLTGELRRPARFARRLADAARGLGALSEALVPAAASSLSGPLGTDRRYELAHARLSEVHAASSALGVTVNDVVLAAVAGAFRDLLRRRGERPRPGSLRTLVPVSARTGTEPAIVDNRISVMLPRLPVDLPSPAARLTAVHHRMSALKTSGETAGGIALTGLARLVPFAPLSFGMRAAARLPQRSVVAVATNVPGPRSPLSVLGRPLVDLYPYVPIALRVRTGVAVLTYCDRLTFGITTDLDSAPERGYLGKAVEHELAALLAMTD
ncbi:wax ester/triacylglycerol synthase family O-acyltransferase [Amycolatopsis sp. NPDC059027]|uniref:wax ester/triacylglycerol synthase family O-acyltransferase n=1 Tax=unclassified Amycolatopsis TaxID=2618356 RepID=UPI00366C9D31